MKYYSSELFDYSKHTPEEMENLWLEQFGLYNEEFEKTKERLPKRLVQLCYTGFFHDAMITDMDIHIRDKRKSKTVTIKLDLEHCGYVVSLIYTDVMSYSLNCKAEDQYYSGLSYLYGELLWNNEKEMWEHNILTTDGEINFVFNKIRLKCDWDVFSIATLVNRPWG